MDKDKVTGLVLISILFLVYIYFFSETPQDIAQNQQPAPAAQVAGEATPAEAEAAAIPDSVRQAQLNQRWGEFAAAMQGEAEEVVLENELIRIGLNSQGGTIKNVLLKEYTTYSHEPLYLVQEDNTQFSLEATTSRGPLDLYDLYYTVDKRTAENGAQQVIFSLPQGAGVQVQHIYTLPADSYQLRYEIKTDGLDKGLQNPQLAYRWQQRMVNLERGLDDSRTRTTLNYYTVEEEFDQLSKHTSGKEEAQLEEPVKWTSISYRFFTSAIIADNVFPKGYVAADIPSGDTTYVKHADIRLQLADSVAQAGGQFTYFFGPNNYYLLQDVTEDFGKNVDLGWFIMRPINKWLIIPVFHFLENYMTNYGIIIFLLVLFIKMLLFPLTYKSYIGMAKMRVLKPQIDELKEKHGEDPMRMQQEQMKLYSQLGINPISGCLPMLLQMPIIFAMFYFFPNSIELRQESFLWADDLSTYDSIVDLPFTIPFYGDHVSLFTLLMTISTIIYTYRNQQMSAAMQGPMKTLSYIMPITFLFFLNSFPAALTYYYFVSNVVTFAQQDLIRKFVNDDKILALIERNRVKNKDKKKGGFQARLEEALRAGQEAQKNREPQGKKPKK